VIEMPHLNDAVSKVLTQAMTPQTPAVAKLTIKAPEQIPEVAAPNKAAFERVLTSQPSTQNLLDSKLLEVPLDQVSTQQLKSRAAQVPKPFNLLASRTELTGKPGYTAMSDKELVSSLMRAEKADGSSRFSGIRRDAKAIEASGVLKDFQQLAERDIQAPNSEFDRSIADDSLLVMKDFAKMSPEQIQTLKDKAYQHPEFAPDLKGSLDKGYYGCNQHKAFGALVEQMTGGILSAEEAMSMNPCGGIPGAGADEIPLASQIGAISRHAMRHDATGFLLTRFGTGPGYGSPTSVFGLASNNPMAGQILGIARETFGPSSEFPEFNHIAMPERFA
jgi:hypothetical protein